MNFQNVVCIHKYHPAFTEKKILSLATIWMNLKDTKGNKPGTEKHLSSHLTYGIQKVKAIIMAHICIPSTLDVEAGRSHIGGQPELHGKLELT